MDNQAGLRIQKAGEGVTWLSIGMNVVLGGLKVGVGIAVQSKALIGDGLHSLVDMSTDVAVLLGLKMAAKPGDENHPYGHHKFASLSTLFIAIALVVFCFGLMWASVVGLIEGQPVSPEWPAVLVALISLVSKEWLYWRTRRVALQEKSRLLLANAWHHRTDSISSLLVFAALIAVLLGGEKWAVLDKAIGLVLGAFLLREGIRLFRQACEDLLDTAPEQAIINDLREHVLPVEGARAYHDFRVRRVGDLFEADLHLQVDGAITVEEGHEVARRVKHAIRERHPEVVDVLIHVEPAVEPNLQERGVFGFGKSLRKQNKQ